MEHSYKPEWEAAWDGKMTIFRRIGSHARSDLTWRPTHQTQVYLRGVKDAYFFKVLLEEVVSAKAKPEPLRVDAAEQRNVPVGYLRQAGAAKYLSIGKRTLAEWQASRKIGHRKIRGVVCFKITELDAALEKFKIKAVS